MSLDEQLKRLNPARYTSTPAPDSPEAERIYAAAVALAESRTRLPRTGRLGRGSMSTLRYFDRPIARRAAVVLLAAAIVAVFIVPFPTFHLFGSSNSASGLLIAGNTGPCAGQPPGCGSPEGSASALAKARWSSFPDGPLAPRSGQVEVWTGHELLIWGGDTVPQLGSGAPAVPVADGAAYDPATRTWRLLPPAPLSAREGAAAAWTGTEMVVVGGDSAGNGSTVFGDAAEYDPATNTWQSLPSLPIEPRTDATAIWTGTQLIVIGGKNGDGGDALAYEDAAAYDPASNSWATLPAAPAEPGWNVVGVTQAWTGRQLLMWVTWQKSGSCGNGCIYVDPKRAGYALAAGATAWRKLPKQSVESNGAATAWTGSSVLVMGGEWCARSCPPPVGAGASYNPTTRVWTAIPNFLNSQQQWPAVWTGRAFIDTNQKRPERPSLGPKSLSAYNTATSTWVKLPQVPHENQLVFSQTETVWTGRQLLVWGQPSEELG
jgi:hypothetical protein